MKGISFFSAAAVFFLNFPISAQEKSSGHPTDFAGLIRDGILLMQAHQFADAEGRFSQAIRLDPNAPDARVWRGICENQLKRYQAAATDFQAALHIEPGALPAHYNLALSLLRLKHVDQAEHEFEIVTRADPTAVEAQYNLALLLENRHEYAGAREHLEAARQVRPSDVGVTEHLLMDDLRVGKSGQADQLVQDLASEAAAPEEQLQTGTELLRRGYFPQSVTLLEVAHRRLSPSGENDLLLARAYIGSNQGSKAIPLLSGNAAIDASQDAAYLLGLAYLSAGEPRRAEDAFHHAIRANPRDGGAFFQLALLEEQAGGEGRAEALARALSNLRQAVVLEPGSPTYTLALGRLLLESDKPGEAVTTLSGSQAQPAKRGERHEYAERTEEALRAEEAERALLLGIAQAATSGVAVARPALQRALQLGPRLPLAHNVLGFCYFSEGHYAQAAAAYRQASDLAPENDIFAYDAALAFERAGAYPDALIYAQRASALPKSTAEDHYLLGKLYLQSKDRDGAIRELKAAARMKPELESPYYLLARTYMQAGNSDEARQWSDQLALLKEKHSPASDDSSGSSRGASSVSSSLLLQGAPVKVDDTGVGH